MLPLYTQQQYDNAKGTDKLPCECKGCTKTFYKQKRVIRRSLVGEGYNTGDYCSQICVGQSTKTKQTFSCVQCSTVFEKMASQVGKNNFCGKSCAATYNNKHKKFGTRTSKFELYCQGRLVVDFPQLDFLFNNKEAIESELDIYIPALRLAFELNGIVHYEPIYGTDKFERIKNNDIQKVIACYQHGIELAILDTSKLTYNKESRYIPYYNHIHTIIEKNLNRLNS